MNENEIKLKCIWRQLRDVKGREMLDGNAVAELERLHARMSKECTKAFDAITGYADGLALITASLMLQYVDAELRLWKRLLGVGALASERKGRFSDGQMWYIMRTEKGERDIALEKYRLRCMIDALIHRFDVCED